MPSPPIYKNIFLFFLIIIHNQYMKVNEIFMSKRLKVFELENTNP